MAETSSVTRDMLLSELQNLLRLTAFEQTIAAVRRTQAASTPVAEELKANYAKSLERSQLIADAVRQVGGVPDVVGAAFGKAGAFVQTQVNQVQTLQGALLGDLALEHQLRDRARYARTLAESLGYAQLIPVFERLEVAHSATIEWLEQRLTEVGRTGTSALRATPTQQLVGAVRKISGVPFGIVAAGINRGSTLLHRGASTAVDTAVDTARTAADTAKTAADAASDAARTAVDTASDAADTAVDTASKAAQTAAGTATSALSSATETAADAVQTAAATAADAAQTAAETASDAAQTAADTVTDAAQTVGDTAADAAQAVDDAAAEQALEQVLDLTDVDEDRPPFAGYASLSGDSVMRHVRDSDDVEHLREILAFEQAHKARKGVLRALEDRLAQLSGVTVSA